MDKARELFKLIYKVAMILVTLAFAGGAVLAYVSATPGNGLLLISGILAFLTLIAGLSITKLDDQDERAATYRTIIDDVRSRVVRVPPGVRPVANPSGEPGSDAWLEGISGKPITMSVQYSEPEVHRVDSSMLEEAKRMAADGAPIDDICRVVDPEHDRRDPYYQEAFRRVVKSMIEQG